MNENDELVLLEHIEMYLNYHDILLYNKNSLSLRVLHCLQNIPLLYANNAHNADPPDFYSDQYRLMFDVLRINDSECIGKNGKLYNPIKAKKAKTIKSFVEEFPEFRDKSITVLDEDYRQFDTNHRFSFYKNQYLRVVQEHIRKIPVWKQTFPQAKYKGLVIYDEEGCYFEGKVRQHWFNPRSSIYLPRMPVVVHKIWEDEVFMSPLYDSQLDFVVFYVANKVHDKICEATQKYYPSVVIVDLRTRSRDLKTYRHEHMTRG